MAKTYRMSRATRLINSLFRTLTRFGVGASYRHILTVQGRKTGRLYSTPVDVLELDGQRWLVAAYGPTSWVANARAAGEVTLSRGGRSQQFEVEEAASTAAVPVLRNYITEIRVTRPYFDAGPSSTDEEIAENSRGTQSSVSSITHGGGCPRVLSLDGASRSCRRRGTRAGILQVAQAPAASAAFTDGQSKDAPAACSARGSAWVGRFEAFGGCLSPSGGVRSGAD